VASTKDSVTEDNSDTGDNSAKEVSVTEDNSAKEVSVMVVDSAKEVSDMVVDLDTEVVDSEVDLGMEIRSLDSARDLASSAPVPMALPHEALAMMPRQREPKDKRKAKMLNLKTLTPDF